MFFNTLSKLLFAYLFLLILSPMTPFKVNRLAMQDFQKTRRAGASAKTSKHLRK